MTQLFCGSSELETWWAHTNFRAFWRSLTKNSRASFFQPSSIQHHNAYIENPASMFDAP
jgi:hypothetical protein